MTSILTPDDLGRDAWKAPFVARVAATRLDDPLWVGLGHLVERNLLDTVEASSRAGLDAHDRAFNDGRQSAFFDLLTQLRDAWDQAHSTG